MLKLIDLKNKLDSSDMNSAITNFPNQIQTAFSLMDDWEANNSYKDINNILIIGMGGSAIGGDLLKVIVQNECEIPILVNRSYSIPKWVNKKTLVIASSYSGNTEETLSAFRTALSSGAKIISITTGGKLEKLSVDNLITDI